VEIAPSEASFLGLEKASFSFCLHMVLPLWGLDFLLSSRHQLHGSRAIQSDWAELIPFLSFDRYALVL
jgi:hypothetical protein